MKRQRITSIDFVRGVAMILMALDHVRMYFGEGTWYAEPTDLATTTPLLFFTRWITHFCAPVFVFLAGTSAYLSGTQKAGTKEISRSLLIRGLWLIFAEIVIVNFAWTFDITYSFIILQVIWAISISMLVLSAIVFLPERFILLIGLALVLGHNLLDSITTAGNGSSALFWYMLHQQKFVTLGSGTVLNFVYPVLPWIGLMALGYVFGAWYKPDFDSVKRRKWLLWIGVSMVLLFIILRGFNIYGEPKVWSEQKDVVFSLLSFLNTTKYPPSLHFLLMAIGPALILLAFSERMQHRVTTPIITLGKVPFFFYIIHLYFIHALAMLYLVYEGHKWNEYILSAGGIRSGSLINFGVGIETVYAIWILVIVILYPLCGWYQIYKQNNPSQWWLGYL